MTDVDIAIPSASPAWSRLRDRYDRTPTLSDAELEAVRALVPSAPPRRWLRRPEAVVLERLVTPLVDAIAALDIDYGPTVHWNADLVALELLRGCWRQRSAYWGWTTEVWVAELGVRSTEASYLSVRRQIAIAVAYVLGCFREVWRLGPIDRQRLARKIFGRSAFETSTGVLDEVLRSWGYKSAVLQRGSIAHVVLADALLLNGSPRLSDLTLDVLAELRRVPCRRDASRGVHLLHRVLHALDVLPAPTAPPTPWPVTGADPRWTAWVERWARTSTNMPATRRALRTQCLKAGRWLAETRPAVCEPSDWTREICAEWVAAVDRMCIGDFATRRNPGYGAPLSASSKAATIGALRVFFSDCQEWGWIERRFDPGRALLTPRAVRNSIGPNPQVIDDAVWAKLLWAGLNLAEADLPTAGRYPLELVRALALCWLFSGSRSNEIVRLRVGCVRWQTREGGEPVCLLDIPITKTSTAFTRPVDPILGHALEEWERKRPVQPQLVDWRTGERVDLLFELRAKPVGRHYLNLRLIPALCAKAGVPEHDVRGHITSHRARATIASHLYNAKEPLSLAELQRWLGHRSPQSTQYYAELSPTTLARAYSDAGYFARNLRTIEVLIDRDAVESGDAAAGKPWRFFDLGHGFCTYTFFEQCPHRMACARCDFYRPKRSARGQILEGRTNLERLLKEVPLTDDERAAVEEGTDALGTLLDRLADVPTPAGPTPRQLAALPLLGGGSATTHPGRPLAQPPQGQALRVADGEPCGALDARPEGGVGSAPEESPP